MPTDQPRPLGSAEHRATRDRIVRRFQELGYVATVLPDFVCDARIECAGVENILARRPNDATVPGVVVAAHYDSVAAGPGMSDDGVAVATLLETARAVRDIRTIRPVSFLVTDGEETGLFGAKAFVADPVARTLADTIINIENRGPAGAAFMFQTSRDNYGLVQQFARGARNPVSTSLFVSIYELLPNDTDLTVFKRAGFHGINFAAIRDPYAYHTPLDAHRRVNPRTVQHYGDNVLGSALEMAKASPQTRANHAVHFDVLSLFVVRWPERFSTPLAATLLLIASVFCTRRRKGIALSLLFIPAALLCVLLVSLLIGAIGTLRTASVPWLASPQLLLGAMWLTAVAVTILVAAWLRGRVDEVAMLTASTFWWSVIGLAVAFLLPGGSYLFLVPTVLLIIATAVAQRPGFACRALTLTSMLIAAVLWFPFAFVLYDALGARGLAVTAVAIFFVVAPSVPWFAIAGRTAAKVAFVGAFVLAWITAVLPASTRERPRPLNLTLYAEQGAATRWVATAMTVELKNAATFDNRKRPILPWSQAWRGYIADANEFRFPSPSATGTRTTAGATTIRRLRLASERDASMTALWFRSPERVTAVRVNGRSAPVERLRSRAWNRVVVHAAIATIELETAGSAAGFEAWVVDTVYGLPPSAANLIERRDAGGGAPHGAGDVSVAARRIAVQ